MIHDLDETLKQILVKQGKLNAGDIDITFEQPTGEWAVSLSRPTINLYLYDIRENVELRDRGFSVERENGTARRVWHPKRIDLSYLITVWARNPEDEHQILWRVLHTLSRVRKIKSKDGIGTVLDQPYDMPTKVALPSDALRNIPDLWGVMENQLKPSINFLVTVALDTEEVVEAPMVFTTRIAVGQSYDPPSYEYDAEDWTFYHIGGRVLDRDVPVGEGIDLELLNRGDRVTTDAAGRFVFAHMQPGEYDVEVTVEGQKPKKYKLSVPSDNYDVSL